MTVVAYWPLDDDRGSGRAVSALGGPAMSARVFVAPGITPTAEFSPFAWQGGTLHPWLPPCLQTEAGGDLQGGTLDGRVAVQMPPVFNWAMDIMYRATAPAGTDAETPMTLTVTVHAEDGIEWIWDMQGPFATVSAFDTVADVQLFNTGDINVDPLQDGNPHHVRLYIQNVGAGTNAANVVLSVDGVIKSSSSRPKGTDILAGPSRVVARWNSSVLQDRVLPLQIGQLSVWAADTTEIPLDEWERVSLGNPGEAPIERVRRICVEDGIPFAGLGVPADEAGVLLGPQQVGTGLGVIREAERSSAGGVVYELAGGLAYSTLASRYNQTPTLSFDIGDEPRLSEAPEPTDDDLQLVNRVTVSQAITREVVRVQDNASIAEAGVQPRDLTVNMAGPGQLGGVAGWLLGLGTVDEYRWPVLDLDLTRNPELIPAWLDFRLGGRVQAEGLAPNQLPGQLVDVLAEGWSETVRSLGGGRVHWRVAFNSVPASPYTVGVWAGDEETPAPDAPQRYSPFDSRVSASFDAGTDTSLTVEDQTGGNDLWSQTADFPYDIRVSGVRLRVTAVGAPTGAVQVLTVSQAPINGVEKTIPVGEPVELWTPARYAL